MLITQAKHKGTRALLVSWDVKKSLRDNVIGSLKQIRGDSESPFSVMRSSPTKNTVCHSADFCNHKSGSLDFLRMYYVFEMRLFSGERAQCALFFFLLFLVHCTTNLWPICQAWFDFSEFLELLLLLLDRDNERGRCPLIWKSSVMWQARTTNLLHTGSTKLLVRKS